MLWMCWPVRNKMFSIGVRFGARAFMRMCVRACVCVCVCVCVYRPELLLGVFLNC